MPLPSLKIQIMGGKVCLMCKGKTLLGIVNNLSKQKVCWHRPSKFCLIIVSIVNFPVNNLNFHWRLRWWDQIQAIFLNIFYSLCKSAENCLKKFDKLTGHNNSWKNWLRQIWDFFCNQILAGFWYLAQLCVCCCHGAAVDGFDLELAEHRGTEPDLDKENILKRSAQCQESKIGAFWGFKYSCRRLQNSRYFSFPSSDVLHNCV